MRLRHQLLRVDRHAIALDLQQHERGRQFDLFIHIAQLVALFHLRPHRLMQLQGHIRIFGRIFGRTLDRHFIETDLRHPLAAHILIRDRLAVQMAQRKTVHVMALVRLENIRLQQRVMRNAAQRDAVIRKDMRIVFQVLPDLRSGRIFQPRSHPGEHGLARQLRWCILITMCNRNVRCDTGFAAQ